jgi:hypothetical protein
MEAMKIPVTKYGDFDKTYGDVLADMLKSQGLDPKQYSVRGIVPQRTLVIPRKNTFLRRTYAGQTRRAGPAWQGVPYLGRTLADRTRLYAVSQDGARLSYGMYPIGGTSRFFSNSAYDPTMDIVMTDKYLDKAPDGSVLLGSPRSLSADTLAKQKNLSNSPMHLAPHRVMRRWYNESPTAPDDQAQFALRMRGMQRIGDLPEDLRTEVVRSGTGKTDDITSVVLRPHNTTGVLVTRNGVTTGDQIPYAIDDRLSALPFSQAVRGEFRHYAKQSEQSLREYLRSRLLGGDSVDNMRSITRDALDNYDFGNVPDKIVDYLIQNTLRGTN